MSLTQTTKEVIRASLAKLGVYDAIRKARGKSLGHLQHDRLEDRFETIYRTGHWTLGDPGNPGSGAGSSLAVTNELRNELPHMLKRIETRTLLDVGCGDFTWMKEVDLSGYDYIGADIVASVAANNNSLYGTENIRFMSANATCDELPDADTVIIREVLFHLCFEDVKKVLRNVLSKPRRYLLITSDDLSSFNADIRSGDWRLLNLRVAPFNFPEPEFRINDSAVREGRHLGIWRAEQIVV